MADSKEENMSHIEQQNEIEQNQGSQNADEFQPYLETYGMHIERANDIDISALSKHGYQSLPPSSFEQINMLFQQIPGLVTNGISSIETYRVYFDKSLGVLQKAKQGDGFLRGNIVQYGTNNKVVGQVLLKENSYTPLFVNAVFSIMSMVTGQYFLSQINGKLSAVDKNVQEIKQFLEIEKLSKLWARERFLRQTNSTILSIQENDLLRLATIQQLQHIRLECLADINFYNNMIEARKESLKPQKKLSCAEYLSNINDISNNILPLQYTIYLFALSYNLETTITFNTDSDYIEMVEKEIKEEFSIYKMQVAYFKSKCDEFIKNVQKSKEFLSKISDTLAIGVNFFGSETLIHNISEAAKSTTDEMGKVRQMVILQVNEHIEKCSDYKMISNIVNYLQQYNQFYNNSKIELVCTSDKAFIKITPIDNSQTVKDD